MTKYFEIVEIQKGKDTWNFSSLVSRVINIQDLNLISYVLKNPRIKREAQVASLLQAIISLLMTYGITYKLPIRRILKLIYKYILIKIPIPKL